MLLVQKKKDTGKLEVAWMWLPTFLSMNSDLVSYVDEKMTEHFQGRDLGDPDLLYEMHKAVISRILDKFPMPGLEEYLKAVVKVNPGETT